MVKIITVLFLTYSSNVFAYLDPGTGSMILQGIIAGIAAGIYYISMYFTKIKLFFLEKINRK